MNHDHRDSLSRYLEHTHHIPSYRARHAALTDLTFSSLEIRLPPLTAPFGSGSYYRIPINPPMTSWADARPRVVDMDHAALSALNRSPITVKKYVPPNRAWMIVVMAALVSTYMAFTRRAHFLPGDYFYETFRLGNVPGFARWCYDIKPLLMVLVVGIHTVEAGWLHRTRLSRHSVGTFSGVWWAWVVSAYCEGYGAKVRFDELVKEEEVKKQKQAH